MIHFHVPHSQQGTFGIIHVLEELHGASKRHHLRPATQGHLAKGCKAVGNIRELQAQGGRQITCRLSNRPTLEETRLDFFFLKANLLDS